MTDENSPIEALFQLQRDTIKQTEEVAEGIFDVPTEMSGAISEGVDAQREVQDQAIELSRQSIHRSLDATGTIAPEDDQVDDLRDAVDETFDTLKEQQDEAFEAVEEGYDSFSEDAVGNLSEQIDLLIEVNESIEKQLSEAVEQFPDEAGDADNIVGQLQEQLNQLTSQFEQQLESFSELETQLPDTDDDEQ